MTMHCVIDRKEDTAYLWLMPRVVTGVLQIERVLYEFEPRRI